MLSAIGRPNFRASSRCVANMVGIPVDQVNLALVEVVRKVPLDGEHLFPDVEL